LEHVPAEQMKLFNDDVMGMQQMAIGLNSLFTQRV